MLSKLPPFLFLCAIDGLNGGHNAAVAYMTHGVPVRRDFRSESLHSNTRPKSLDRLSSLATATPVQEDMKIAVSSVKRILSDSIVATDLGRRATDSQKAQIEQYLQQLEQCSSLSAPTRSPLTGGAWKVEYTTAPPPSNGQLGPFKGTAQQIVDLEGGTYRNLLVVPPNDWLTAALDATWTEWDGILLDDESQEGQQDEQVASQDENIEGSSVSMLDNILSLFSTHQPVPMNQKEVDYGATCWKVTFETLTIQFLGIPILTKTFTTQTQRIWRTTYLDDDTRIVRAGRTGLRDDEMVFYMTRCNDR